MPKIIILTVDDEEPILKLLKDLLTLKGYKVVQAQNGLDALKILKKIKPDLILLDFFMPRMSGKELCDRIRADSKLKNLKILFLTVARFSQKGVEELKNMGVLDYIQKPFNNNDLIQRIKNITEPQS